MIRRATSVDATLLAPLFFQYHQFYKVDTTVNGCERFLFERLSRNESVVFVAQNSDAMQGFTQLYPIFSSLSMQRAFILNDLFVVPAARRLKIAEHLMNAAERFAISEQAKELVLQTAHTNTKAQALYEKLGYVRDNEFYTYSKAL